MAAFVGETARAVVDVRAVVERDLRTGCTAPQGLQTVSPSRTAGPHRGFSIDEAILRNARTLPEGAKERAMSNKDPDKTQPKPEPEPPQQLSDLPPKLVTDEDGKIIKGGPSSHPWFKSLT